VRLVVVEMVDVLVRKWSVEEGGQVRLDLISLPHDDRTADDKRLRLVTG
jgi:hypothetical protein